MDRIIKFRAWSDDLGKMIKDFLLWDSEHGRWQLLDNLDPRTLHLMEYIGIRDMNHREVYEGDIIQSEDKTFTATVKKVGAGFWLVSDKPDVDPSEMTHDNAQHLRVVGNTFEGIKQERQEE